MGRRGYGTTEVVPSRRCSFSVLILGARDGALLGTSDSNTVGTPTLISLKRFGGAEVWHRWKAHGIVDGGQVCWFGFPAAAAAYEFFAFRFEGVNPFFHDGGFIDSRFERAIVIVPLGHGGYSCGLEQVFDLVVGELAHQAGDEAAAFFADDRIAQAIFRGQALGQCGLADGALFFGGARLAGFFPERLAGPYA